MLKPVYVNPVQFNRHNISTSYIYMRLQWIRLECSFTLLTHHQRLLGSALHLLHAPYNSKASAHQLDRHGPVETTTTTTTTTTSHKQLWYQSYWQHKLFANRKSITNGSLWIQHNGSKCSSCETTLNCRAQHSDRQFVLPLCLKLHGAIYIYLVYLFILVVVAAV